MKKELAEIKDILTAINKRMTGIEKNVESVVANVETVRTNQKVSDAKVEAWETDFKNMRKQLGNIAVVCEQTAGRVQQIHTSTIDTTSKIGARVRKLELVKEPASGGRRPPKKN